MSCGTQKPPIIEKAISSVCGELHETIVRLQTAHDGEPFLPDDRYEMVETHDWPGDVDVNVDRSFVVFDAPDLDVVIDRESLAAAATVPPADSPTRIPSRLARCSAVSRDSSSVTGMRTSASQPREVMRERPSQMPSHCLLKKAPR